jgi:hypothetical protein
MSMDYPLVSQINNSLEGIYTQPIFRHVHIYIYIYIISENSKN